MNPLLPRYAAVLAVATSLLAGCASPYRTALTASTAELGSTSGAVTTVQREIGTSIRPSTGGGVAIGGLIGAIVDSAANATSAGRMETYAGQVRQALLDYDFPVAVQRELSRQFEANADLHVTQVHVVMEHDEHQMQTLLKKAEGDAALILVVDYRLDPDFAQIAVLADVYVCAKSEALRKKALTQTYGGNSIPVLYRNSFQSTWRPSAVSTSTERQANAAIWAAQGGQPAREVLDKAAAEIAAMLAWDLTQPDAKSYSPAKGTARTIQTYRRGAAMAVVGAEVRTESGRSWLRLSDGRMAGY